MGVAIDTVTAEIVLAPIANALTASHGWPAPKRTCLLYREENILVVLSEIHVDVFELKYLELCEAITRVDLPRELYEAARDVVRGLKKLTEATPLVRAALE